ncbi:hypothetical protein NMG60_11004698 [Bertholletia excelsa]
MHHCHVGSPTNTVLFHKSSDPTASCCKEEPFGFREDTEARMIGDLLPEEDELFSEVIKELEGIAVAKGADNAEDIDLFSNVGGLELEIDDATSAGEKDSDFTVRVANDQVNFNGSLVSTRTCDEQPSRTLFVRNINSNVGDSELRALFEQYGDIWTLYTGYKHRGFVMISYFDIRAASNAKKVLQNKLIGHQELDIHYSIPKDNNLEETKQGMVAICSLDSAISNDDLRQIFGIYGEIKEIHETLHKCHHKFIEFYDVRAAEAAHRALKFGTAKQKIKLEPSCPGAISLMQNCPWLEQNEGTVYQGGKTVGCGDNGLVQGLDSVANFPISALTENAFSQGVSYFATSSSPLRVASTGNPCFGFHKSSYSPDQVKLDGKCISTFHPHSLPDCQDTSSIFVPHNCCYRIRSTTGKIGPRPGDRIIDLKGEAFSTSGHQRNNSNSFHLHPLSPSIWPNSPLFSNSLDVPCPSQLPGYSGVPFTGVTSISPPQHLLLGSAPSVSPLLWDKKPNYTGGSPEVSASCVGSVGNLGLHSVKVPHICPGRNIGTSMPMPFGSPRKCERIFCQQRNQSNSRHTDKKQFELDIDRILRGEDSRTTLMIKNIPNKYIKGFLLYFYY